MRGVVRAGPGDDRRAAAEGFDRGLPELELLAVAQRRRLARRAADDDPVGAVLDEELRQLAEAVEVDASVGTERGHDRGEDLAEHPSILRVRRGRHGVLYSGWLPDALPIRNGVVTPSYATWVTRPRAAWRRMWQWNIQHAGIRRVDGDVVPVARADLERVDPPRPDAATVVREDEHVVPVQVHRVCGAASGSRS